MKFGKLYEISFKNNPIPPMSTVTSVAIRKL